MTWKISKETVVNIYGPRRGLDLGGVTVLCIGVKDLVERLASQSSPFSCCPWKDKHSTNCGLNCLEGICLFDETKFKTTTSSSNGNVGFPSSSKSLNFATRPGFGTVGTKCIVKANHFFAQLPDKDLNQYDVTITPEVSSRTVNRSIIAELVRLYKDSDLGMRLPAYDGRKSLYTAGQLPFSWKDFMIKLVDQEDGLNYPKRVKEYKVVIKCGTYGGMQNCRRSTYTKTLNEKHITSLLKVTCQRPRDRENDILQTIQHNAYDQDPYAKEFGITISEKQASVEA
ncbi:hypothetical protein KIW84_065522 [Lathyrus oleraceus]|uniref:Protein argonaute N-terminal domain-containing protein n=1 Tax=Pisum sativum TaxID=3888 RepID=A0A9D4WFL1_PEA|nr:hypothetical protein KIW84_065522 [Pisum sativum]